MRAAAAVLFVLGSLSATATAAGTACAPEDCRQVRPMAEAQHVLGPFTVDEVSAQVTVLGPLARTQLRIAVANEGDEHASSVLSVPLPADGVLTGFVLHGAWGRVPAQVVDRGLRPAADVQVERVDLLRADDALLSLRVALPPGGAAELEVDYVELVPQAAGHRVYRLPLAASQPIGRLEVDLVAADGAADGAAGGAAAEPRFPGLPMRRATEAQPRYMHAEAQAQPRHDLVAVWPEDDAEWSASAICAGPAGAGWVEGLFLVQAHHADSLPADRVFVLDRSGSMAGTKIQEAREAVQAGLAGLREQDAYAVLLFDHEVSGLQDALVPVDLDGIREDRLALGGVQAGGWTDIDLALQEALRLLEDGDRDRMAEIVLVTDGYPSRGVTDPSELQLRFVMANERPAVLDVVAIGMDARASFLNGLATSTGGVLLDFDAIGFRQGLEAFLERIGEPLAHDIRIRTEGFAHSGWLPGRQAPIYRDTTLTVAFGDQWPVGVTTRLEVHAQAHGGATAQVFEFTPPECAVFPPVAALASKIRLEALVAAQGAGSVPLDDVRRYAVAEALASPWTEWVLPGAAPLPPAAAAQGASDDVPKTSGSPSDRLSSLPSVTLTVLACLLVARRRR